jgi:hypothetical protein
MLPQAKGEASGTLWVTLIKPTALALMKKKSTVLPEA